MVESQNNIEKYTKLEKEQQESHTESDQDIDNSIKNNSVVSINEAFEDSGGFGKFQCFSFSIIVMGMAAGAFILYNLYYFELEPIYLCTYNANEEPTQVCTQNQICSSVDPPVKWIVDYTNERSLHNWVEQLDLYCRDSFDVGFLGSSFFIGAFIGSFILPRLADIKGRKPMFLLGLAIYVFVVLASLFNTSLYLAYVILFFGGISETGRYYVAYVYAVEMMPDRFQNLTGLLIFVVFGILQISFSLYFWKISKYWQIMAYSGIILAIISFIITYFKLPDTPRYFYSRKKFDEARKVLDKIREINGKEPKYYIFDTEGIDDEQSNFKEKIQKDSLSNDKQSSTTSQSISVENQAQSQEFNRKEEQVEELKESELQGNLNEIIRSKTYLRNLLIMIFIWSFGSFGFFLIPFYLGNIKGNIYLFAIFSGSAELLASLACLLITRWLSLKYSLILFIFISLTGFFLIMIFEGIAQDYTLACIIMLTNFGVTSAFDIAYLVNNSLFPTIFLATAYGCCNIVGRFITILSPEIARLDNPIPMLIMISFAGFSGFLGFFLKTIKNLK